MKRLEDVLRQLPGSSEGIAKWLIARGIKGIPHNARECPIARWLSLEMGAECRMGMQTLGICGGESEFIDDWSNIASFRRDFDLDWRFRQTHRELVDRVGWEKLEAQREKSEAQGESD